MAVGPLYGFGKKNAFTKMLDELREKQEAAKRGEREKYLAALTAKPGSAIPTSGRAGKIEYVPLTTGATTITGGVTTITGITTTGIWTTYEDDKAWPPPIMYPCIVTLLDLTTKKQRRVDFNSEHGSLFLTVIRTFDGVYLHGPDGITEVHTRESVPESIAQHMNADAWKLLLELLPSAVAAVKPQEGVYGRYDDQAGF